MHKVCFIQKLSWIKKKERQSGGKRCWHLFLCPSIEAKGRNRKWELHQIRPACSGKVKHLDRRDEQNRRVCDTVIFLLAPLDLTFLICSPNIFVQVSKLQNIFLRVFVCWEVRYRSLTRTEELKGKFSSRQMSKVSGMETCFLKWQRSQTRCLVFELPLTQTHFLSFSVVSWWANRRKAEFSFFWNWKILSEQLALQTCWCGGRNRVGG